MASCGWVPIKAWPDKRFSTRFPTQKYTTSDAAVIKIIIDAIYVTNKKVFIGTPEGMTFFDEEKMTKSVCVAICGLPILRLVEKVIMPQTPRCWSHSKEQYSDSIIVGISFRSVGDITLPGTGYRGSTACSAKRGALFWAIPLCLRAITSCSYRPSINSI